METKIKTEERTINPVSIINGGPRHKSRLSYFSLVLLGMTGIIVWIIMFSMGMLINSEPYRTSLIANFSWEAFFMSVLTYTPTNIVVLCLLASFAGGCASRLLVVGIERKFDSSDEADENKNDSTIYLNESPFSSMLRGLVVYFAFVGGVYVASADMFANTTPQLYTKSAGIVSLLSFIVGYDPTVFRSLISLGDKFKKK